MKGKSSAAKLVQAKRSAARKPARNKAPAPIETKGDEILIAETAALPWLTPEIRSALAALTGDHAAKKRATVLAVAFAVAYGDSVKKVFERDDTCAENIWYGKWKWESEIEAALKLCTARAIVFRDDQTAADELRFRLIRKRLIAEYAAEAPKALAQLMRQSLDATEKRKAANDLLNWAEPETAQKIGNADRGLNVSITADDLIKASRDVDAWTQKTF